MKKKELLQKSSVVAAVALAAALMDPGAVQASAQETGTKLPAAQVQDQTAEIVEEQEEIHAVEETEASSKETETVQEEQESESGAEETVDEEEAAVEEAEKQTNIEKAETEQVPLEENTTQNQDDSDDEQATQETKNTDTVEFVSEAGWVTDEQGNTKYRKENGNFACDEILKIDGAYYAFDDWENKITDTMSYVSTGKEDGSRVLIIAKEDGELYVNEWVEMWGGRYYCGENGALYQGFQVVDGKWYFFDEMGAFLYKNRTITTEDGTCYIAGENGEAIKAQNNAWTEWEGQYYYVRNNTFLTDTVEKIGNALYGFNNRGQRYDDTEFEIQEYDEDGNWTGSKEYCAKPGGALYAGEWKIWKITEENDKRYYQPDGNLCKDIIYTIDGNQYYFNKNGWLDVRRCISWRGNVYFADDNGVRQKLKNNSWNEINGEYYYVKDGVCLENCVEKIGEFYYGFKEDGTVYCDRIFNIWYDGEEKPSYYCAGKNGALRIGWYEKDGERYYFGVDGKACEGMQTVDENQYYFRDGKVVVSEGIEKDGKQYVSNKNGILIEAKNNAWIQVDGMYYYVQDGKFLRMCVAKIGNNYYGFDHRGIMHANEEFWIYEDIDREFYYRAEKDGSLYNKGWYYDGNSWYFYGLDGKGYEGIQTVNGNQYYFRYGEMLTEMAVNVGGKPYLCREDGTLMEMKNNAWTFHNGKYYYVKDKKVVADCIEKIGGSYYGFEYNGRMFDHTIFGRGENDSGSGWYYQPYTYFAREGGALYLNCWIRNGENWYYAGEEGAAYVGIQTVNGKQYYFDQYGRLNVSSIVTAEDGKLYDSDSNGVLTELDGNSGWKRLHGNWYYIKDQKLFSDGIYRIGNTYYGFRSNGTMYTNMLFHADAQEGSTIQKNYLASQDGSLKKNTWAKWNGKWYYFGSDGAGVQGVQTIDGKKYFFEKGEMQTSCGVSWKEKYYICKADGTLAEAKMDAWTQVDGNWYYMKKGVLLKNSVEKIGNARYVFDEHGIMQKNGFFRNSEEGSMCYAKEDGTLAVHTWMSNGAAWYYFDDNGKSVEGVQIINKKKYYFMEGVMQNNSAVSESTRHYVAKADGTLIEAKNNSWVKADENWYYVKNGEFCKNEVVQISGKYYLFDRKGRMKEKGLGSLAGNTGTEWVYAEENGNLLVNKWKKEDDFGMMYFGKDGKALGNGVYTIGGVNYLFDSKHSLCTSSALRVNKKNYAADENGKAFELQEKWNKVGRYWYYVKNGKILDSTMETIGSNSYYFDRYGRMTTGKLESCVRNGMRSDYTTILTNEKGEVQKNKLYESWNGTYLFDADGTGAEGFRTISGIRRYFRAGEMMQSKSFQVGDTYYAAADNGKVVTLANNGWTKVDSDWYYVDNGKLVKRGRIIIKGKTYVFDAYGKLMSNAAVDDTDQGMLGAASDGTMLKNSWAKLQIQRNHGGYDTSYGWLYFDENGQAVEGLQTIKGKQYYFQYGIMQADKVVQLDDGSLWIADHNGVLKKAAKNGWTKADGNWYYATNGAAAKNCIRKIGTEYYAFDRDGKMKVNGNFEIENDDEETYGIYHAKVDGTLLRGGSWKAPDGELYYFDTSGKAYEGLQKVNGVTYWFEQGRLTKNTAVQDEDGNMYVMDAKGRQHDMKNNQWIKVDGYYYYAMDGEVVRDRIVCVDGKYYAFDENGKMYDNKTFSIYGNTYHAAAGGALLTSTQYKSGKDTYYFDRKGVGYEGVHYIAGKRCVFEDGKIVG